MQTLVTKRGQTVVPADIRKRYQIEEVDRLAWIDDGSVVRVVPVPEDPIRALRGSGKALLQCLPTEVIWEADAAVARGAAAFKQTTESPWRMP